MADMIGVVGAGQMGNGIAHVFARFGFQVWLYDISAAQLENALQTIALTMVFQGNPSCRSRHSPDTINRCLLANSRLRTGQASRWVLPFHTGSTRWDRGRSL